MVDVIRTIRLGKDVATLTALRGQLEQHPVFDGLTSLMDLRNFMKAHVFAVWDFMSLLKRLQRDLTCVEVPWIPRRDKVAAHLINEIVLGEESDTGPDGQPASHLDIYLEAMREIGADTTQFTHFLALIADNVDPVDAMHIAGVPEHVRTFVAHTLRTAKSESTLTVLASFFHGRENVIPRMFDALLRRWNVAERQAPMFVFYLRRHIEVDGGSHGPMAQEIIERIVAGDSAKHDRVVRAAIDSLAARIALWDGVRRALQEAAEAAA